MEVNEFRVSSIWVDAVPAVLAEETGRFGNLVDRSSYAALLKKLIDDPDADDLVTVPWPRGPRQEVSRDELLLELLSLRRRAQPPHDQPRRTRLGRRRAVAAQERARAHPARRAHVRGVLVSSARRSERRHRAVRRSIRLLRRRCDASCGGRI